MKSSFGGSGDLPKEEQRRFEILLSHWDLPLKGVDWTASKRLWRFSRSREE